MAREGLFPCGPSIGGGAWAESLRGHPADPASTTPPWEERAAGPLLGVRGFGCGSQPKLSISYLCQTHLMLFSDGSRFQVPRQWHCGIIKGPIALGHVA